MDDVNCNICGDYVDVNKDGVLFGKCSYNNFENVYKHLICELCFWKKLITVFFNQKKDFFQMNTYQEIYENVVATETDLYCDYCKNKLYIGTNTETITKKSIIKHMFEDYTKQNFIPKNCFLFDCIISESLRKYLYVYEINQQNMIDFNVNQKNTYIYKSENDFLKAKMKMIRESFTELNKRIKWIDEFINDERLRPSPDLPLLQSDFVVPRESSQNNSTT